MARSIQDGTNVDAPTVEYPNGRTRDKSGSTPGTVPNEAINGDAQQFFAKLMRDTTPSITPSGNPDNETNGYQLFTAFTTYVRDVLIATTTARGTVEKATETERDEGTVDKYIDAELLLGVTGGQLTKNIEIGSWNMTADDINTVAHGITDFKKIRNVSIIIINDEEDVILSLEKYNAALSSSGGAYDISASNINLMRTTNGEFDQIEEAYSSTSINRGWITIKYLP